MIRFVFLVVLLHTLGDNLATAQANNTEIGLLVTYKNDQGKADAAGFSETVGTQGVGTLQNDAPRFKTGKITVSQDNADAVIDMLQRNPNIENVEFDAPVTALSLPELDQDFPPNDHQLRRKLPEANLYGMNMMNAPDLWALTEPRKDKITVCVVDTGYDLGHPDLPDSSHGVDGWDPSDAAFGVWNVDGNSHGTHCAGTIGARGDNDSGVTGVIDDPSAFTFYIGKGLSDPGGGTVSSAIRACNACADNGAKVISMSLGTRSFSQGFANAMSTLYDQGILVVAAAGNGGDSGYGYPASHPPVIAVAAVDSNGNRASFSQINDQTEISAPGVGILSTIPGGGWGLKSGTSMACPHVAGVAAMVWSYFPECTNFQIRNVLLATAFSAPLQTSTCDTNYGHGIVNAKAAYDLLKAEGCRAGGSFTADVVASSPGGCNQGASSSPQSPTPSPTPASCVGSEVKFSLVLTTDRYPTETSWTVTNKDGDVVFSSEPYLDQLTSFTSEKCLEPSEGPFTFTITDSRDDGLCCGYGAGSFDVSYGTFNAVGGEFESLEVVELALADAPSSSPTGSPTWHPTRSPSSSPVSSPSVSPTVSPSDSPTTSPSASPVATSSPSTVPTTSPSFAPTTPPSPAPTNKPSSPPSRSPTSPPTSPPTTSPTSSPTSSPSASPSLSPTFFPTMSPTSAPSEAPASPTAAPTSSPTEVRHPTGTPTISHRPSMSPTASPSSVPTAPPSVPPTQPPTESPVAATSNPTATPVASPTSSPVTSPTSAPIASPTSTPIASPTSTPIASPTSTPVAATSAPVASDPVPWEFTSLLVSASKRRLYALEGETGAFGLGATLYFTLEQALDDTNARDNEKWNFVEHPCWPDQQSVQTPMCFILQNHGSDRRLYALPDQNRKRGFGAAPSSGEISDSEIWHAVPHPTKAGEFWLANSRSARYLYAAGRGDGAFRFGAHLRKRSRRSFRWLIPDMPEGLRDILLHG